MADLWVPGFTRVTPAKQGVPYRHQNAPYRFTLHSTETAGMGSMPTTHPWPPQLWVDPNTGERYQGIPLNLSGFALAHPSGTVDTNHMKAVQVEIVARASDTHTYSDAWYSWLAHNLVGPVCEMVGIDPKNHKRFWGAGEGHVLATSSSPIRMSNAEWTGFNGVCGHQHVPVNDHWDPGKLSYDRILKALGGDGSYNPAPPAPPPAQKVFGKDTLRRGDKGSAVKDLQGQLNFWGFDTGGIDGDFGPKTESAVKAMQARLGVTADGIWGPKTHAAYVKGVQDLGKEQEEAPSKPKPQPQPKPPVNDGIIERGDRGDEVKRIQQILKNANNPKVDPGAVDGIFGAKTERAVKEWQRILKLNADGVWGPKTEAATVALIEYLKNLGNKPKPKPKPPANNKVTVPTTTLRRGNKGTAVGTLQRHLNTLGANLKVDNVFGPATEGAVKNIQKYWGLTVDGIVGRKTWGIIEWLLNK